MIARLALLSVLVVIGPAGLAAEEKDKEKKGEEKGKKGAGFEYPLKVGTTWTYRVGENRFLLKVTKLEKVGGQECARLETIINGKTESYEHVAVARVPAGHADEGTMAVMRYSFEGKEVKPPLPVLLLPEEKTAWKINSKMEELEQVGTFRRGKEDVEVPAGTYKGATRVSADNLRVNGVNLNIVYHFVSGVGMVKQVAEMEGGQAVTILLEKVEVPK